MCDGRLKGRHVDIRPRTVPDYALIRRSGDYDLSTGSSLIRGGEFIMMRV